MTTSDATLSARQLDVKEKFNISNKNIPITRGPNTGNVDGAAISESSLGRRDPGESIWGLTANPPIATLSKRRGCRVMVGQRNMDRHTRINEVNTVLLLSFKIGGNHAGRIYVKTSAQVH